MKIFISWSGKRSKSLANAIKDWIPLILQYAKPWVSDKDISAGDRWAQAVAGELESSNFGILCITPENIRSEWILFEAGALSKSMLDAKVIPLLFGLELSDLRGPLQQFQALKVDQQGLLDLVKAINGVSEVKTPESTIHHLVPALWPSLQEKLDLIPEKEESEKHMRPQTEILEDLVTQVRALGARMRDFDPDLIDRDILPSSGKYRDSEHFILDNIFHLVLGKRDDEMALIILAGFIRDRMPWISEVLIESHRELKTAGPKEAEVIAHRLIRLVKESTKGPLAERMIGRNKSSYMLMMELPRIIERIVLSKVNIKNKLEVELDEFLEKGD